MHVPAERNDGVDAAGRPDSSEVLQRAADIAKAWLAGMPDRHVPARIGPDELAGDFGGVLPAHGLEPSAVIDLLAEIAEPGLAATASPRFYGMVIGGTYPVAIAADWLTSAWDQNAGLRNLTPAHSAAREAVERWLTELLGLPAGASMGLVTGGTMANFTGLAVGRDTVLRRAGWNVAEEGLQGAPRVRVLVTAERHDTVDVSLRYLGLGAPEAVAVDDQGRIDVLALEEALARSSDPTVLVLQAGNIHSGAFDDFTTAIPLAHAHGAWVHVDGAFGLWAGASRRHRGLVAGVERADSWSTDAHKTLNVPYDCGIIFVADAAAHRASMGVHAPYLIESVGVPDPMELVPELSQRARAFPLWATLRFLGTDGVEALVDGLVRQAQQLADGVREIGGDVVNDVVFTQVCTTWGDDRVTQEVERRLLADGAAWMSGSVWHGRRVLRIAVSKSQATDADVDRSLASLQAAFEGARREAHGSSPHQ